MEQTQPVELTLRGLGTAEAQARMKQYGPNAIPEAARRPGLVFLQKMWGPVPWMLQASILLELLLGKYTEVIIIALLVLFNAALGTIEENRSQDALAVLRQRLKVNARVLRDGIWQILPAEALVPGDVVHIRMGDLMPADVRLADGQLLLDQSALTGESLPVEAGAGETGYAGTTVRHGEATGEVVATGPSTRFGKTADLVRQAKTSSHLEEIVFAVVKNLVFLDGILALAVLVYALAAGIGLQEILPFVLILLVASVPVALPATFTIGTALGAQELARQGVLVTHLAAIEEAAGIDILCSDKTGTITENQLAVADICPYPPYKKDDVLRLAALACDDATQDPIDLAILKAARSRNISMDLSQRQQLIPFDPATKRSEAVVEDGEDLLRVVKGAPHWVTPLCVGSPTMVDQDTEILAANGYRILAVAAGQEKSLHLAGLLALQDPPRADSQNLIGQLHELNVRVVMITGDGLPTARSVASQIGIGSRACSADVIRNASDFLDCDVFAEVLPEDKFNLVQALQKSGHMVGMTGDGVNDAPALKQAQVGIAVSNATDVAKAAASLILTRPGLDNVIVAIETSRRIYQRMLTYTLNKIIKTLQIGFFLSFGLILAGTFVTTPRLIILLLFANDFVTMSIATDRVGFSNQPDRWHVRALVTAALSLALPLLLLSFGMLFAGKLLFHLPTPQLQTLLFTMLVFSGQGMVYLVRERHHFWGSRPGSWLLWSTLLDVSVIIWMAARGILMAPVPFPLIALNLGVIAVFLFALDFWKVKVFKLLQV